MKFVKSIIVFAFILTVFNLSAQLSIYPYPHKVVTNNKSVAFDAGTHFYLTGDFAWIDTDNQDLLSSMLPMANAGVPIHVEQIYSGGFELLQPGAYTLKVSAKSIDITAFDNTSFFYALQTLSQIINKNKAGITTTVCQITDYPDVALRGTVEGFYGTPWSFEDRISQLKFYGKIKLNTYIYGPKDDPYHSTPHWRDAYPADKANQIKKLVAVADKNKVHFVWAIHPGKDIQWNLADSMAVLNKFEAMYQLGVRAFAVFFDDISGEGTKAEKQAGLLNFLQSNFVDKNQGVLPLIMCPTEYNKAWSNKKPGTYLDILGKELNPDIHIMWTGNTVVSDITAEGLQWVNNRIKRPAFVWWNFPVSDYVRNHLLMGASYGIDTSAKTLMSGFVSNPMERAEASKVAIFGVGQYTWNMQQYNPEKAWQLACAYLMPKAAKAFELFCANNADPGKNGHGYRRTESAAIKPMVDAYLNDFDKNNFHSNATGELINYFQAITDAPAKIRANATNANLIKEINPWLTQFHLLGLAGGQALQMISSLDKADNSGVWRQYVKMTNTFAKMDSVEKHSNQNPYQKGVKTGSLVLMPFVQELYKQGGIDFIKSISSQNQTQQNEPVNTLVTNVASLQNQLVLEENRAVSVSPKLEIITLQPKGFIGLNIDKSRILNTLLYHFTIKDLNGNIAFQSSSDGENWQTIQVKDLKPSGKITINSKEVHYLRAINISGKSIQTKLNKFEVETKNKSVDVSNLCYDANLNTYQVVAAGTKMPLRLNIENVHKGILILLNNLAHPTSVVAVNKRSKEEIIYKGNENYVWINKEALKRAKSLYITASNAVQVYEVIVQ